MLIGKIQLFLERILVGKLFNDFKSLWFAQIQVDCIHAVVINKKQISIGKIFSFAVFYSQEKLTKKMFNIFCKFMDFEDIVIISVDECSVQEKLELLKDGIFVAEKYLIGLRERVFVFPQDMAVEVVLGRCNQSYGVWLIPFLYHYFVIISFEDFSDVFDFIDR